MAARQALDLTKTDFVDEINGFSSISMISKGRQLLTKYRRYLYTVEILENPVRFHEIQAVYQIFLSIRMKKYLFSLARLVLGFRRQSYVFNDFRFTENTGSAPFQRT